jgi:hypothetical protein
MNGPLRSFRFINVQNLRITLLQDLGCREWTVHMHSKSVEIQPVTVEASCETVVGRQTPYNYEEDYLLGYNAV